MNYQEKFDLCYKAFQNAYAKYSNYPVGAVVILKNGQYFLGANVENMSYGLSNCAERSAMFAAYSNGYRKEDIQELCLVSRATTYATPCGACRQVMAELLDPECDVVMFNLKKEYRIAKVKDLLPYGFTEDDLNAK
jgi:cytidine deaminase